jgi:hypothetical protein
MPVTVHLKIAGLCLYVPDDGRAVMHVLMPRTGHGDHPEHFVALAYDRAYKTAGSPKPSGEVDDVRLDGHVITVAARDDAPPSANRTLDPKTIVKLAPDVFFSGAKRACVGPGAAGHVTARVELHAGSGEAFDVPPGKQCLDFPEICADPKLPKRRLQLMTERVRWTVADASPWQGSKPGSLDFEAFLRAVPFTGGDACPLPELYAIDDKIELVLLHVVESLLPRGGKIPKPGPSTDSHFDVYYDLATRDMGHRLKPRPGKPLTPSAGPVFVPSEYCAPGQAKFD